MVATFSAMYLIYVTNVKISIVIEINGSVLGFFYLLLFPIAIHLKCVYFSKHEDEVGLNELEMGKGEFEEVRCELRCNVKYRNKYTQYG